MKKILKGAVIVGVLFAVTSCVAGPVNDKRAPGELGHKTFQLEVDDHSPLAPDELWITVTERQWDDCGMGERYPACTR